jgi:hypothetical protein
MTSAGAPFRSRRHGLSSYEGSACLQRCMVLQCHCAAVITLPSPVSTEGDNAIVRSW